MFSNCALFWKEYQSYKDIDITSSGSASKRIMNAAGVPLVPGYHGDEQSIDYLKAEPLKLKKLDILSS